MEGLVKWEQLLFVQTLKARGPQLPWACAPPSPRPSWQRPSSCSSVSTDGHPGPQEGKLFTGLPKEAGAELSLEFISVPWWLSIRSGPLFCRGKTPV